jgi:hypothetical protein
MICNHFFVDGFGGMGDAVVCIYCGLDKYAEAISLQIAVAKLQRRFIKESHPEYKRYRSLAIEARKQKELRNVSREY